MPTGIYKKTEKYKKKMSKLFKSKGNPFFGKQHTLKAKEKISKNNARYWLGKHTPNLDKKQTEEHRKNISLGLGGLGIINNDAEEYRKIQNSRRIKRRHELKISKRYNSKLGISYTKEYKKMQRQRRKALVKRGGKLTIRTIQLVYEDNIKNYGTLTCYLCLKPIPFGKDHLEHKIPLSRGGTNLYENLGIACQKCNSSKGKRTEEEYRKEIF